MVGGVQTTLRTTAPSIAIGIEQVRARAGRVALGTGVMYALPTLLGWLGIVMPLDFWVELPRWVRACCLAVAWGGAAWVLWWWGFRVLLRPQPDDRIALRIERALPVFRSRYIASVQLARELPSTPAPSLVAALLEETTEIAHQTDFRQVVTTDHLRRWRNGLILGLLVAMGLAIWGGRSTVPLLRRAFLFEDAIPRKTAVVDWTGNRTIAVGDDLPIEVTVAGQIPAAGTLRLKTASGGEYQFTLDADPAKRTRFARTLSAVQESFTYSLHVGDNHTPTGQVDVRPRPVLLSTAFTQQWPAYVGLPPQPRQPNDLKLLAGSRLLVRVKPNVALAQASMVFLGQDRKTVLQTIALRPEGGEWSGAAKIPAKDLAGLTFHLKDTAGVESQSMAVTPVTVVPDLPPTIQITWPLRREELVTSKAALLVAFDATDDLGLGGVRLHYAVNWTEGARHNTIELDLGGQAPRNASRRFEWNLERIVPALKLGDVIDYWFEVRDINTETGPGVTTTADHYQARVVSEEEKRADLAARLGDTLSGLNEVRQEQQDLNQKLGDFIQALPRQ